MSIVIQPNKRLLFVGKTRSGKTYLANYLLKQIQKKIPDQQIIIIDPKHELVQFDKKGKEIEAPKLVEKYDDKASFQVFQSYTWIEPLDRMVDVVLKRGKVTVVLLELGGLATATSIPSGITRLWTQGGGKDVGAWAQIQQPRRVPSIIKSQSEHFFLFRINPVTERQDLLNYIPDEQILQRCEKYWFWYYSDDLDVAQLYSPIKI
jgi:hypothetical protein